jgi:transposase
MMAGAYLQPSIILTHHPGCGRSPSVAIRCRVWIQNYWWDGTQLQWREADNIPPAARFISSPYDPEAHYARKHTTQWVGYKVHITETCEDDLPHLITHIETTPGPTADGATTPQIHAALQQRGLLPGTHIVDTGFLDADLLVQSRDDYGVELLGPIRLDYHWQAREGAGFDAQHFQIDWDRQHATCPAGKTSISWTSAIDNRKNAVIKVKFSSKDCRRCAHLTQRIRSKKRYARRTLTIRLSHNTRRSRRPGNGKPQRRFRRSMRAAPASKGRSRARHEACACDGHATSASDGCTWDISSQPWG